MSEIKMVPNWVKTSPLFAEKHRDEMSFKHYDNLAVEAKVRCKMKLNLLRLTVADSLYKQQRG